MEFVDDPRPPPDCELCMDSGSEVDFDARGNSRMIPCPAGCEASREFAKEQRERKVF